MGVRVVANNTNSNLSRPATGTPAEGGGAAPMASIGRPGLHTCTTVAEDSCVVSQSLVRP